MINKRYDSVMRWLAKHKETLKSLIGDKCEICGSKVDLSFHKIHGRKHPHLRKKWILEHYKSFVCLCNHCHGLVHSLAKKNYDMDELARLVNLLKESCR